jgi:hypothetical protein
VIVDAAAVGAALDNDLVIKFKSGKTYTYLGAGGHAQYLVRADSAGKYFNEHIKNHYALAKS